MEQIHISPICLEVSSNEFETLQSNLHRTSYWPKLTEILTSLGYGEYKKDRTDMYHILLPYKEARSLRFCL